MKIYAVLKFSLNFCLVSNHSVVPIKNGHKLKIETDF